MTPHRLIGAALTGATVAAIVFELTHPAVFAVVTALWLAFAVSVAVTERREWADHQAVERMAERERRRCICEDPPEFYRDAIKW